MACAVVVKRSAILDLIPSIIMKCRRLDIQTEQPSCGSKPQFVVVLWFDLLNGQVWIVYLWREILFNKVHPWKVCKLSGDRIIITQVTNIGSYPYATCLVDVSTPDK